VTERPLGRSGLVVSRLGLGLAAIGRPAYINLGRARDLPAARTPEALYRQTAGLLDAARAAGVRYLDVARSYGRAEEFLARWLAERGVPPRALTIGSKWGYRYTAGWTLDAAVHAGTPSVAVTMRGAALPCGCDLVSLTPWSHRATLRRTPGG